MRITRSTVKEFKRGLKQFRKPSQEFWEHHLPSGYTLRLSNGCEYFRIKAGAYWIFDAIASFQQDDRIQSYSFQLWEFKLVLSKI
jgi:hypothetical protein